MASYVFRTMHVWVCFHTFCNFVPNLVYRPGPAIGKSIVGIVDVRKQYRLSPSYTLYSHFWHSLNPTLWSDIHSLQWLYKRIQSTPSTSSRCGRWSDSATIPDEPPVCPCTLPQALVDVGRFEPHPECNIDPGDEENNCFYKVDAVHCVRATQPR